MDYYTVTRILKKPPTFPPSRPQEEAATRTVTAKYPNHVWHVDLTVAPTSAGFWAPWFPLALPQCWPFGFWILLVVDHFSRRCMGFAIFPNQPSAKEVKAALTRLIRAVGKAPKYIISDKGGQFWCDEFKAWCKRNKIKPRFGAVGKYGSIAIIERFIRSLKSEFTRRVVFPMSLPAIRQEISFYVIWYNIFRPHQGLDGQTPFDMYSGEIQRQCHYETRGPTGDNIILNVTFLEHKKELPIIKLQKAA